MIVVKSPEEVEAMRRCGKIWTAIMERLKKEVKPGTRTRRLNDVAGAEAEKRGAKLSFKNYQGFPSNLCVSVNDEVVHGIPGERILQDGDIVSLDLGIEFKGFHTDAAISIGIGEISEQNRKLLATTEGSLKAGIAAARCRAHIGDISRAIQDYVEARGFSVVREYTGHGIGRHLHEEPQVPNFYMGKGSLLRKGMTLAIEPMVNVGTWRTKVAPNKWTVLTEDGSCSAHFEHDIAITDGEAEILA